MIEKFVYRITIFVLTVFLVCVSVGLASAQKPKRVYGEDHPLVGVTDVVLNDNMTIVLTSSFPVIHVFTADGYKEWGRKGNGPSELDGPASIVVNKDTLFVLDFRPGACKVVSYSLAGAYISSQPIREAGMCYGMKMSDGRRIVEVGEWGSPNKELIQLGKSTKRVFEFNEIDAKKLSISGGPMNSFSIRNPFLDQPIWGVNQKGDLILWDGKALSLSLLNITTGKKTAYLKIKENQISIHDSYVDNWINSQYPTDKTLFGRNNFYKNVRKEAKQKIIIPEHFPLLKSIAADPSGGIWIQRAYYRDEGEIWRYLTDEMEYEIDFPAGRKIMAFGKSTVAALKKDENGVEFIEIYNRNDFLH